MGLRMGSAMQLLGAPGDQDLRKGWAKQLGGAHSGLAMRPEDMARAIGGLEMTLLGMDLLDLLTPGRQVVQDFYFAEEPGRWLEAYRQICEHLQTDCAGGSEG